MLRERPGPRAHEGSRGRQGRQARRGHRACRGFRACRGRPGQQVRRGLWASAGLPVPTGAAGARRAEGRSRRLGRVARRSGGLALQRHGLARSRLRRRGQGDAHLRGGSAIPGVARSSGSTRCRRGRRRRRRTSSSSSRTPAAQLPTSAAGRSSTALPPARPTRRSRRSRPARPLAPGGFYLLGGSAYAGTAAADQSFSTGLAGTGGGVGIRDTSGALVDSVGWGTATNALVEGTPASAPPATAAPGSSIARIPDGHDTSANAADFAVTSTATPKGANR